MCGLLVQYFYRIAVVWTGNVDLELFAFDSDGTALRNTGTAQKSADDVGGCNPVTRGEEYIFSSSTGRDDARVEVYNAADYYDDCPFEASVRVYGFGQLLREFDCDDPDVSCVAQPSYGLFVNVDTEGIFFPCEMPPPQ